MKTEVQNSLPAGNDIKTLFTGLRDSLDQHVSTILRSLFYLFCFLWYLFEYNVYLIEMIIKF